MPRFRMEHRVRYRECDPMGVVYHAHYIDWFEEARTEALRDLGLPYAQLEADGIIMPVVDLAVSYHHAARYDDMVEIITIMSDEPPRARVRFDYEVQEIEAGRRLATGHVTLCFFDTKRGRPIPAPPRVHEVYRKLA